MSDSSTQVQLGLDAFNALPRRDAETLLDRCLSVPRWVDEVAGGRPYRDLAALRDQAKASAEGFTDDELETALASHPRIGERPESGTPFSRAEQAGVAGTDAERAQRIRTQNEAYEQRFGRVFLIRAAGRSADEILAELDRRLGNDDEAERRETVGQLRDIALRRLDQVVGP